MIGEADEQASELASGYAPRVRSIRHSAGAIEYPTPDEAAALVWTDEDRELVHD